MTPTPSQPPWRAALTRFEDGYGDPPDFNDPVDVAAFMPLLEDAVRAEVFDAVARGIELGFERARADRLKEQGQ